MGGGTIHQGLMTCSDRLNLISAKCAVAFTPFQMSGVGQSYSVLGKPSICIYFPLPYILWDPNFP